MPRKWTDSLATRSLRYWARLKYISAAAWLGVKVRAIIDDVQACYRCYDSIRRTIFRFTSNQSSSEASDCCIGYCAFRMLQQNTVA